MRRAWLGAGPGSAWAGYAMPRLVLRSPLLSSRCLQLQITPPAALICAPPPLPPTLVAPPRQPLASLRAKDSPAPHLLGGGAHDVAGHPLQSGQRTQQRGVLLVQRVPKIIAHQIDQDHLLGGRSWRWRCPGGGAGEPRRLRLLASRGRRGCGRAAAGAAAIAAAAAGLARPGAGGVVARHCLRSAGSTGSSATAVAHPVCVCTCWRRRALTLGPPWRPRRCKEGKPAKREALEHPAPTWPQPCLARRLRDRPALHAWTCLESWQRMRG